LVATSRGASDGRSRPGPALPASDRPPSRASADAPVRAGRPTPASLKGLAKTTSLRFACLSACFLGDPSVLSKSRNDTVGLARSVETKSRREQGLTALTPARLLSTSRWSSWFARSRSISVEGAQAGHGVPASRAAADPRSGRRATARTCRLPTASPILTTHTRSSTP
jgi:hypothetical protein